MTAERVRYITEEEYLEDEKHSPEQHEYFDGEVFAMAGASDKHELVAGNLFGALLFHLRGKGCRVYKGDMKLRLPPFVGKGLYYYPDVMVACDPEVKDDYYRERPRLVIEVLSKDQDLFTKALSYRRIPSLEEIVIADPNFEAPIVHISRRSND